MSLRSMVGWDMRLQARYGLYTIYAILTIVYAVGVRVIPPGTVRETGLVLLLFSDPSFLSFYFVAALVLFEKEEGVIAALVTTPLSTKAYLWSKALSLTALALLATVAVTLLGFGLSVRWLPLLAGVGLSSVLFVFVGFVAVARFDSINAYFMTAIAYLGVLGAPVFGFLGIFDTPVYYILPAQPTLVLLEAAVGPVPDWELVYAVGYLVLAIPFAYVGAHRSFKRHINAAVDPSGSDRPPIGQGLGSYESPVANLAVTDLKNWIRDPLLIYIGLSPLLIGLVGRWLVPYVGTEISPWVDLHVFYPELAAMFALLGPTLIGFAVGFFILEDREMGIVTALRLTPLTGRGYVTYRLLVAGTLGFLAAVVIIPVIGLVSVPPVRLIGIAAVAALYGPITALLLASFASNTVEGIALSKFFGILVMVPIFAIAFISVPSQLLAGFFPAYWAAAALVWGVTDSLSPWLAIAIGAGYNAVVLILLVNRFLGRPD